MSKLRSSLVALFFAATLVFSLSAQTALQVQLPPDEAGAPKALAESPRHGEWVPLDLPSGDKVDLWVVYPERKDPAPVVLVIHEIFGLTDWARAVADRLAAEGFLAIAPDFLSGKGPGGAGSRSLTAEQARAAMGNLKSPEILARLDAAMKYGTSLPSATKKAGVVGFCWGGGIAFSFATVQPELGASVVYYGTSPSTQVLSGIKSPVLGLYGGNDARVNATVPAAETEMKRLGLRFEPVFYDGAGHAFLRQLAGQNGANQRAADKAWPRTLEFLRETLEHKHGMAALNVPAFEVASDVCEDEECLPATAVAEVPFPVAVAAVSASHSGH